MDSLVENGNLMENFMEKLVEDKFQGQIPEGFESEEKGKKKISESPIRKLRLFYDRARKT